MNQCEMGCTVYMAVGRLLNRMHSIAWLDSRRVLCIVLLVEKPPRKFSNGLPSTFYERRPHFTTFQAKFQEAVKFYDIESFNFFDTCHEFIPKEVVQCTA